MTNWRITFPIEKAEQREDGLFITGLASGPEIDATGERMDNHVIHSFADQINSTGGIALSNRLPYRDAHAPDGVLRDLGWVTKAWVNDQDRLAVEVKLDDDNPAAMYLFRKLKSGKQYGMSVAGKVLDFADEFLTEIGKTVRTYKDIILTEISNTTRPAWTPSFGSVLSKAITDGGEEIEDMEKAVWSTSFVNGLPDSSFAYIEPGGKKDSDGKTTPRSLRHLPYKDASGNVDAAHVRNALARLDSTDISADAKASAKRKLEAAAKEAGVDTSGKSEADIDPDVAEVTAPEEDTVKSGTETTETTETTEEVQKDSKAADDLSSAAWSVSQLAQLLAEDNDDSNSAETAPKLRAAISNLLDFMGAEAEAIGSPEDEVDTEAEAAEDAAEAGVIILSDETPATDETEKAADEEAVEETTEESTEETAEKAASEDGADLEKTEDETPLSETAQILASLQELVRSNAELTAKVAQLETRAPTILPPLVERTEDPVDDFHKAFDALPRESKLQVAFAAKTGGK